ncbi:type 2 lanthipeptide synthetase LanM family protein [Phytohabitans rumicis]|uniref:type 2 lanthipeptide synthetase LanM family protein n=1 Tax=Phytohabitans rumicis TaxID=1076125 RepID=UPI001FE51295|nr:type 2 lanthipeptide synthetase LanM family protein [Phytohabitans rumicis]
MTGSSTTPAATPPAAVEGWWAAALALGERLAAGVPELASADPDVDARIEAWRGTCDGAGAGQFTLRLADAGIDESGLRALLAEPASHLGARASRPSWVRVVEGALGISPLPVVDAEARGSDVFAGVVHPFVEEIRRQLAAEPLSDLVDAATLNDAYAARLGRRLAAVAAPVLVAELHAAKGRGELSGTEGGERFADFVRQLAAPGRLAALLARYPVLGRLLGQHAQQAVDSRRELLARFVADRPVVVDGLLAGRDPGRLVAVHDMGADAHRGGRSVAALVFSDGRRVIYKPRAVAVHVRFAALVAWLNGALAGTALRTPAVIARDGYGWLEFVAGEPVPDLAAADRFYRRQGALLALLHLVGAVDIHRENLVAAGDQPVVVDVETVLHPMTPVPWLTSDPAADRLASSVHRTGVLPMMLVGDHGRADMSALGGDGAAPAGVAFWDEPGTDRMRLGRRSTPLASRGNRVRLDGVERDPVDHEPDLLAGFRAAYNAIMRDRVRVGALLRHFADVETRVVVRPTQLYRTLLDRSNHPAVLRDALDRDRVLDALWAVAATSQPGSTQLFRHELAELWSGDVPLFTTTPAEIGVRTADGTLVDGLFERSGLAGALGQLDAMSDADRRDQEWIISATLATRRPPAGHRGGPGAEGRATAVDPARLLAAARGIADQLVALAARRHGEVNWLGLELVEERQWLALPMGAGLATGYTGVALFLAELWALTGVERYASVARAAVRRVPPLLAALSGSDETVRAVGCGGMTGFGGIAYALARLAGRLDDASLCDGTRSAIGLAERCVVPDAPLGVFTGVAGCLAAMTAVYEELDLPEAAHTARRCATLLAERVDAPSTSTGFAAGDAGIGWALVRHARSGAAVPDAAHLDVLGSRLLRGAATTGDEYGWCAGQAGVHAARHAAGIADDPAVLDGYATRPVLRDLSLCHGELGILEALAVRRESRAAWIIRRRAGQVCDVISRAGAGCGTPGGVPTPGLLNGLAGIGYGLLRAGFAEQVPSVLLFGTVQVGIGKRSSQ